MRTPFSERMARGLFGALEPQPEAVAKAGTAEGASRGWETRRGRSAVEDTPGEGRDPAAEETPSGERRPGAAEESSSGRQRKFEDVPVPRRRTWIDHAPGVPRDTLKAHTDPKTGRLTPERQALHDKIVQRALEGVPETPEGQRPVAVLMVGTPGSGKTTLAEHLGAGDFAHVEADLYKQQLPEYKQSLEAGARDAAGVTHEEGKLIANRVWEGSLDQNKSVLYDATGSWPERYMRMIRQLRKRGYEVQLIMPDLSVDESLRRVQKRFEDTGRNVPESAVRNVDRVVPYSFRKLRHEVDGFLLFDNSGDGPRLVWEGKGGEETVHDEQYIRSFRRRAQ